MSDNYPECKKLAETREESDTIRNFLTWLRREHGIKLGVYEEIDNGRSVYEKFVPVTTDTEQLLADYHDINLDTVEKERRQMLEDIRAQQPTKKDK